MRAEPSRLSWVSALALMALPGSALAQQVTAPSAVARAADEGTHVQEVLVTARKRAESLQETPVAVTAFSQENLRQIGATRLDDIAAHVPNLVLERDAASNGVGRILLRGVGALNAGITNDPGVGLYLDGVLIAKPSGSLLDVLDVQRIEVLRGPQGTLFGRNTVGGAINVITIKPGPGLGGFIDVMAADPAQGIVRAGVNVPLVDGLLYARISGAYNITRGYSYNTFDNQYYDNVDRYALRGALRYTPSKYLTIDLTGDFMNDNSRGPGVQCRWVNVQPVPGFVGLINFVDGIDFKGECQKTDQPNSHNVSFDAPAQSKIRTYGASATVDWSPGQVGILDNLDVKAIFGYRHEDPHRVADLDAVPFVIIHAYDLNPNKLNQYSAELQLTGDAIQNHLHFVTGFYEFKEDGKSTRFTEVVPNVAMIGLHFNSVDKQNIGNNAQAVYGQATYDLNKIISVTGGARYTTEKKGFVAYRAIIGANDPSGPVLSIPTNTSLTAKFNHWTSMANITLHAPHSLIDGTMLDEGIAYFTFSQGFKSGGFNAEGQANLGNLNKYDPETLDSYEVGLKLTAFDHRLVFDAAYFISDYNNIQIDTLTADAVTGNIVQDIVNAAKARINGVELEATAYPIPHLELSASVGTTHAKYLKFLTVLANGTPVDATGVPFTRVPDYTVTLAAQYNVAMGGYGTLTPRLEWNANGVRHFSASPTQPEAIRRFTQGGYSLWNARLAWDLADGRTEISIFGRNLFDKHYMNDGIEFADSLSIGLAFYGPPRMVGLEINHKF